MITNKKIYELVNNQFQNPFSHFNLKVESPFILLGEEDESVGGKEHSNLMINYHLFILKLMFTPNTIWQKEEDYVDVVMQSDLSEIQIVVSETEKKKMLINYTPAIVIRFKIFKRKLFKTVPSLNIPLTDPATKLLIDLANFEVIDIYDKVVFKTFSAKEMEAFRNMLKKHEAQFKHLFFSPKNYPSYQIEEDKVNVKFPEKSYFNWNIIKGEEQKNDRLPDQPSIL